MFHQHSLSQPSITNLAGTCCLAESVFGSLNPRMVVSRQPRNEAGSCPRNQAMQGPQITQQIIGSHGWHLITSCQLPLQRALLDNDSSSFRQLLMWIRRASVIMPQLLAHISHMSCVQWQQQAKVCRALKSSLILMPACSCGLLLPAAFEQCPATGMALSMTLLCPA